MKVSNPDRRAFLSRLGRILLLSAGAFLLPGLSGRSASAALSGRPARFYRKLAG